MRIAFFDVHRFEKITFEAQNKSFGYQFEFIESRLNQATAALAHGFEAVCVFVNDRLDRATLQKLSQGGTRLVALRCAGFNQVDLEAAAEFGIRVVRVPAYSPHAVAEHALALIMTLNRKTHRAFHRVRELNFSLEGLVGFDLYGKTVGILGTGKIGEIAARILSGFGCRVLAYDRSPNPNVLALPGAQYCSLAEIYRQADILSLHVPLNPETRHLIDQAAFEQMKPGVMVINTGRGALIDAKALIEALKSGQVGSAGLDVYEEEEKVFFQDLSDQVLQDDVLARLLTFPNVLITSHQAFLTTQALQNIAQTTIQNISDFEAGRPLVNEVSLGVHVSKR